MFLHGIYTSESEKTDKSGECIDLQWGLSPLVNWRLFHLSLLLCAPSIIILGHVKYGKPFCSHMITGRNGASCNQQLCFNCPNHNVIVPLNLNELVALHLGIDEWMTKLHPLIASLEFHQLWIFYWLNFIGLRPFRSSADSHYHWRPYRNISIFLTLMLPFP